MTQEQIPFQILTRKLNLAFVFFDIGNTFTYLFFSFHQEMNDFSSLYYNGRGEKLAFPLKSDKKAIAKKEGRKTKLYLERER